MFCSREYQTTSRYQHVCTTSSKAGDIKSNWQKWRKAQNLSCDISTIVGHRTIKLSTCLLHIYMVHLESMCWLSNVTSQLFCLGHFAYGVIPYWGGATPSQINSLRSIQAHHLTWGSTSLLFGLFNMVFTHTLTHGRQKDSGWACSNGPHMFFYVH